MSERLQITCSDRVTGIVKAIAEEENTSVSKVLNALVEEGLRVRGAMSKESKINDILPTTPEGDSVVRRDSLVSWANTRGVRPENPPEEVQTPDDEDMRLLKKLKMLKELGLL